MISIIRKTLLLLILLIVFFKTEVYSKDRIAVVGNSLASGFAWANQIDLCEKSCSMFTRHAVAGDGLDSHGFICSAKFDGIEYFPGEGKNFIKNIIEDSSNYDIILFMCGTNELLHNLIDNSGYYDIENVIINQYKEKLRLYLDKINFKSKIILFTIPKVILYKEREEESRSKWNDAIKELKKDYQNVYIEDFSDYNLVYKMDGIHFTEDSYKKLYEMLILKYQIK